MDKKEPVFPDGFIVKRPHQNAPDWIVLDIILMKNKFLSWVSQQDGDYVNIQVKESKKVDENGAPKIYAQLDDWEPSVVVKEEVQGIKDSIKGEEVKEDDIPF